MGIIVRQANLEDVDWLISCFHKHAQEVPTMAEVFNYEHATKALVDGIENHLVLVAEKDGEPLGYIAGWILPHFFNPEIIALTQALWYVVPGMRGGKAAKKLLDAFTEFGEMNANWIWLDLPVSTNIKEENLAKIGYSLREKWYFKEAF